MAPEWTLEPGESINRTELHDQFGGGRRGGMEPSASSPNMFLFSSAAAGAEFGYDFDGWHSDGTFHYTGEGQVGDQVMTHGNRALIEHAEKGRAVRLFEKDGTDVIYVGEFSVPNESHILLDEAPDRTKTKRSVFVFRLQPVGDVWVNEALKAPPATLYRSVPVESFNTEEYVILRESSEPLVALRVEAGLVKRYMAWLNSTGISEVSRQSIPTPAGHLMFTDLFVEPSLELIEAKGSSSREHVRTALGQILDYSRYVDHTMLAVLTPTRPAPEMIALLHMHGISSIWESGNAAFDRSDPVDAWSSST